MRNKFVISDTHFCHANILKFKDKEGKRFRGSIFNTTEEMNEKIIENWNSVVCPQDIVYHLGDVYFGNTAEVREIFKRLNGHKRLIVGNHDNIKQIAKENWFQKIQMWRMFAEEKLLLTHVPVHESALEFRNLVNIHGHIHQNTSPEGPYINVSAEAVNYTPVAFEELKI
jgi:calcineurin-like phosphoesterase family protein